MPKQACFGIFYCSNDYKRFGDLARNRFEKLLPLDGGEAFFA